MALKTYFVTAVYYDTGGDFACNERRAHSPFEAMLLDYTERYNAQRHEACQYFEQQGWDISVICVDGEENTPRIIPWAEIKPPYHQINELRQRRAKLQSASEVLTPLLDLNEVLQTSEENPFHNYSTNVESMRVSIEERLTKMEAEWKRECTPPPEAERDPRHIQVGATGDSPSEEYVDDTCQDDD